jgi:arylsulfatase A-like enzyme
METDAVIGRVLDALEKSGAAAHTLVLLTSDNGKAAYTGAAELEKLGHFSSGPLRGYKASVWEGGHREPFIVRWPGVVQPGSTCSQNVQQADIMATLAEVWGAKLPDNAGEDSFSFLPLLKGADKPTRENAVNTAGNGLPSLRKGPWKLVFAADPQQKTKVQLYNLDDDLGETKNLASEKPELVAEMTALMEQLIVQGRSTPGEKQKNDVTVTRYPRTDPAAAPKRKAKQQK